MGKYLDDVFYAYKQARDFLLKHPEMVHTDETKASDAALKAFSCQKNPRRILRAMAKVTSQTTRHPHTYIFETHGNGSLFIALYDEESQVSQNLGASNNSNFTCILITKGNMPLATKVNVSLGYDLPLNKTSKYEKKSLNYPPESGNHQLELLLGDYVIDLTQMYNFRKNEEIFRPQQTLHAFSEQDGDLFLTDPLDAHQFTSRSIQSLSTSYEMPMDDIIKNSNTSLTGGPCCIIHVKSLISMNSTSG